MSWIVLLLFAISSSCLASTVLIQSPLASEVSYQATLHADPQFVSPITAYRHSHPTSAHRARLLELFTRAQKTYLEGKMDQAQLAFEDVLGLQNQDDWHREERAVFMQCDLRLAQLAKSPDEADRWLKHSFELGSDTPIDSELFPPPLLERRNALAASTEFQSIASQNLDGGWQLLMIDGQPCGQRSCGRWLPDVPVRITFLSTKWQPVSIVTKVSQLASLRPERVPLKADGAAAKAQIFTDEQSIPIQQLKPKPEADPATAESPPIPDFEVAEGRTSVFRSKWFWAGIGGAIAAVVLIENGQHRSSPQPTTTYGN